MVLKQLLLNKKIQQRKSTLEELFTQEVNLNKRAADLEVSIEEAKTDEEIALVEEEFTKLDSEKEELEGKKTTLEGEIAELEGELKELNSKEPTNEPVIEKETEEKIERSKNLGGEQRN